VNPLPPWEIVPEQFVWHERTWSRPMIVWTPIAVNEKPLLRGKIVLPEYSAAVIGSSVVLRMFGGGLTGLSLALTTIPFSSADAASEWIEANKLDMAYTSKLEEGARP